MITSSFGFSETQYTPSKGERREAIRMTKDIEDIRIPGAESPQQSTGLAAQSPHRPLPQTPFAGGLTCH